MHILSIVRLNCMDEKSDFIYTPSSKEIAVAIEIVTTYCVKMSAVNSENIKGS